MRQTFYPPNDMTLEKIMDLVITEDRKRGQQYDNYNTQDLAYRQAISDGAMRGDNYFAT